jgi:hypothetical protein
VVRTRRRSLKELRRGIIKSPVRPSELIFIWLAVAAGLGVFLLLRDLPAII